MVSFNEVKIPIVESETLAHIISLLTDENLERFNKSIPGDSISFPFSLQSFCLENDLKLKLLREKK